MKADRALPLSAVLFVYVIPVLAVAGFLALSGLWVLAVVLVVAEVVLSGIVVLVRRRPVSTPAPTTRPWLVPLVMVLLLAAMVGVAVLAAHAG